MWLYDQASFISSQFMPYHWDVVIKQSLIYSLHRFFFILYNFITYIWLREQRTIFYFIFLDYNHPSIHFQNADRKKKEKKKIAFIHTHTNQL